MGNNRVKPFMKIKCKCGRTLATARLPRDTYTGAPNAHTSHNIWGLVLRAGLNSSDHDVYDHGVHGLDHAKVWNLECSYHSDSFTKGLYRPRDERRAARRGCGATYSIKGEAALAWWRHLAGITEEMTDYATPEEHRASFNDRALQFKLSHRRQLLEMEQMEVERKSFQRAKRNWTMQLPEVLEWWGKLQKSAG